MGQQARANTADNVRDWRWWEFRRSVSRCAKGSVSLLLRHNARTGFDGAVLRRRISCDNAPIRVIARWLVVEHLDPTKPTWWNVGHDVWFVVVFGLWMAEI